MSDVPAELAALRGRVSAIESRLDAEASLRAMVDLDLSAVTARLGAQHRLLLALSDTQSDHTRMLREQSAVLDAHSRLLSEHSQVLGEHSQVLGEHSQVLADHTERLGRIEDRTQRIEDRVERVETGVQAILGLLRSAEDGDSSSG
jgi:chromosome segregation ATPase